MKISDFIKILKTIKMEHGDLEMFLYQNQFPSVSSHISFSVAVLEEQKTKRYSNDPEYLPKRVLIR